MSFILGRSEEQAMLAATLERLVRDAGGFEARRRRLAARPPDRLALWSELGGIGAFGLAVGEERGGFGGTALDVAVLVDALAPALPVEPIIAALVTAGRVLAAGGDGTAGLLGEMVDGTRIPVLAHAEGLDPFAPPCQVSAVADDDGWRINGRKPAVRGADVASDIIVSAALPDGSVGLFVLAPGAVGLALGPIRMIDAAGAADLTLTNVLAMRLLVPDPMAAVADALEWSLMALAVETAALIGATNAATFAYLNVRQQFGQPLARFQALQHMAADMVIAQTEAEAVATRAIDLMAQPPSLGRSRALLLASLAADAAGRLVGHAAIQLHGGMGVSDELVISHYGRRFAAIRHQVASADARQARFLQLDGTTP